MKKYFFKGSLILLILFNFNNKVCAQQLLLSPASLDEITLGYSKVIGQDETGYFILMSNLSLNIESDRSGFKNRKYKLAYFNPSLALQWEKSIEPFSNDASIDAVTFFNGKIVVISTVQKRNDTKLTFYISTYDNTGTKTNKESPVTEFSPIKNEYEKSKILISSGRERIAIVMREYTDDASQTIFASVLDTSFTEQEKKTVVIPFAVKSFDVSGYVVSDKNDMILLGINSEKIKALSSKRKIDYYTYSSRAGDSSFKEFKISSDKTITGLGVAFDNINNQAIFAGFFSERDDYTGSGIFYASLNMELNDEIKIKTSRIDGQNNAKLRSDRNSGMSIIGYPIDRIVLRDDGGAVIVAEAAYTSEYSYYDSFSQSFTRRLEYHFDNVAVISINSDGTVHWSAILEKEQISLDDGGIYSSFCSLLNSENLILLYNDDISKRNNVIPVIVDIKGNLTKRKPITTTDGLLLLPRAGKQVSENSILVPAFKKRKLYLALFTF